MGCCKKNNAIYTYYNIAGVKLADLKDSIFQSYPTGEYCGVPYINFSVDQLNPLYRYFQHAQPNEIKILGAPFSTSVYLSTPTPISQITNKQGLEFMVGGSYNYTYNPNPEKVGIYGTEVTCQSQPCINDVGVGAYYFDLKINGGSASGYPIKSYKESAAGTSSNIYAFGGCTPTSPASTYLINWSGVITSDGKRIEDGDHIEVSVFPDPTNNRTYPVFIELLDTRDNYTIPFNQGAGNADQIQYPYGLCGNYIQFLPGSWSKTIVDSFTWPEIFTDTDYSLVNNTLVGYKDCFLDTDVVVTIPESNPLPDKIKLNISLEACGNPSLTGDNNTFYKQSVYDVAKSHIDSLSKSIEVNLVKSNQNGFATYSDILGTYTYITSEGSKNVRSFVTVEVYANNSVDNNTFPEIKLGYLDESCLKAPIEKRGNNYFYLVYISTEDYLGGTLTFSCFYQGRPVFTKPSCFYPRPNYGFKHYNTGECSFFTTDFGNLALVSPIPWLKCNTDGLSVLPVVTKETRPNGQVIEVINEVSVFYRINITSEEIFNE